MVLLCMPVPAGRPVAARPDPCMHASTHPIDRPDGSEEAFFSAAYAQFGGSSLNSPAHVRRAGRPAYVVVAGKMRQSNKSAQQSELTACGDMITVLAPACIDRPGPRHINSARAGTRTIPCTPAVGVAPDPSRPTTCARAEIDGAGGGRAPVAVHAWMCRGARGRRRAHCSRADNGPAGGSNVQEQLAMHG